MSLPACVTMGLSNTLPTNRADHGGNEVADYTTVPACSSHKGVKLYTFPKNETQQSELVL